MSRFSRFGETTYRLNRSPRDLQKASRYSVTLYSKNSGPSTSRPIGFTLGIEIKSASVLVRSSGMAGVFLTGGNGSGPTRNAQRNTVPARVRTLQTLCVLAPGESPGADRAA